DKRSEQQRSQRRLEEKLASRQAKFAAARQAREAELAEVKRGQDVVLHKALALQADIDEQARKQIVEEHESSSCWRCGNSLQLSRLRQEKGLEAKLAARRAAMSRLQRDTREEKLLLDEQKAGGPEAAKLEARLAAHMEEREAPACTKRADWAGSGCGKTSPPRRAAALKEQEARLGEAIGRLQTGQARPGGPHRPPAEGAALAEAGDGGGRDDGDMRGLDQILQSHRNQMANLSDQMDREKRQQEMLLKERLQRRKLEREEEVKQTVDKEEQEATRALDSSGHGQIARYVLELSLDAKFRNSMMSMEEEMRLEMKRQQEQLDREMEADLQKSLEHIPHTAHIHIPVGPAQAPLRRPCRLTSIPKSEMQDMVDRAGTTAGVGRKLTRQVSRDITDGAAAAAEDAGRKKASRAKKQKAKQPRATREDLDEEEEYRGGSRGRA
uniref:Coiled-coil domain-containing protein 153 n=1 Tax=Macrostomum lignano TaxID=282301 RepID=A0A1I8F615_9PLAT